MLKYLSKAGIAVHVFLYRSTGGKFGGEIGGFKLLLLTTIGRKSGKEHTSPLGCYEYEGGYVVAATNAGQPNNPGWYYNLKSNPQVTIQVKDRVMKAVAEDAKGELRNHLWDELVRQAPGYAGYTKKTTRQIPMVILRPV